METKVHFRIHNSPLPVPNLSQINPVNVPFHPLNITFNDSLPYTSSPPPIRATCPALLIIVDLINITKFCEQYR
jgi:hypothetical protein